MPQPHLSIYNQLDRLYYDRVQRKVFRSDGGISGLEEVALPIPPSSGTVDAGNTILNPWKIQVRHAPLAEWTSETPVLSEGEVGFEIDTGRVKIGDGVKPWDDLRYIDSVSFVSSYAELIASTPAALPEGSVIQVRGGGTYQVQASAATIASVDEHVLTPIGAAGRYSGSRVIGTGYHIITDGGTKLRSISEFACPTHFGAVGDGSTDDTDPVQMAALYAADCGEFRPKAGVYLISSAITYFGKVRHIGGNCVQFNVADSAGIDAAFIPYTWESTSQADMQAKQDEKYRPVFDGFAIYCNGDNGGADYGIILTATEGRILDCWIQNAAEYGILVTPYNKLGHSLDSGYNLLQNWICRNRLISSIKGGVKVLDTLSKTTDGWMIENAILGGSEYGIYIDAAQGWKVRGNQVSSILTGIYCDKINGTIVANNVIHAYGDKTTVGARYGIYMGNLSVPAAKGVVANNTITSTGNVTALLDGTTEYQGIHFGGGNGSTSTAQIDITGNVISFEGFSGTSGKAKAIVQRTTAVNNFTGVIAGNTATSDEDATDTVSSFLTLHSSSRMRLGVNTNGGQRVERRSKSTTSSATPTINADEVDVYYLTALAANITSMSTNVSGDPGDGQTLDIWFTGTATRTITWGSSFTGNLLPGTESTNTHIQRLVYNSTLAKWVGTIYENVTSGAVGVNSLDVGDIDTSVTRLSAGDIAVEGNRIFRVGGADVPVTDGGTGRSTSTTAYALIAAGTTATGVHQTLATGSSGDILVSQGSSALAAWNAGTGTGVPVRANSPTLTTPTISITDTALTIQDDSDPTKLAQFNVSNVPTGTTSTYNLPGIPGTLVSRASVDTLISKSIDLTDNTLTGSVTEFNTALESENFYTTNGTDIAVIDGGTGRSTGTTAYALIATGTTATGVQQTLANGATTEILIGGGASALPVWTTATGSGAPVRATSPTLTTPTVDTLTTTGNIELGHASNCTLSNSGAGDFSVEGNLVYRAGGTDVPVTDGGTGRSTGTTAYALIATGTTVTGTQQTLASGATTEILVGGGASALPVWTTATGSGAPVRATSPTFATPLLGTPTSGNLANCTFPTLNQNTTGSAATLTTPRTIDGTSFNGSVAIRTITSRAVSPRVYTSLQYYYCNSGSSVSTSAVLANGTARVSRWDVLEAITIDRVYADISVIGEAGSLLRIGIWDSDGVDGRPSTLVLDAGTIAGDSATVQEITVSKALPIGSYWVGGAVQNVVTTQPTVRTITPSNVPHHFPLGTSLPSGGLVQGSWAHTGQTGAFGTFSASPSISTIAAPRIGFRVA